MTCFGYDMLRFSSFPIFCFILPDVDFLSVFSHLVCFMNCRSDIQQNGRRSVSILFFNNFGINTVFVTMLNCVSIV